MALGRSVVFTFVRTYSYVRKSYLLFEYFVQRHRDCLDKSPVILIAYYFT